VIRAEEEPTMRNNTLASRIAFLFLSLLLALPAWAEKGRGGHRADLSRLVVVGDSLSAGYQNDSLLETQQPHGYASVVAQQARVPLALPLIAAPGIRPVLKLLDLGPPPVIVRETGTSTGRTNPAVQAFNLAVPGHNVQDALTTRPQGTFDNLTDFVLGFPGLQQGISRSQVEWAEVLHPTTILLWIGNNDALGAATTADTKNLTDVAAFEAAYGQVIDRLAATGANLVVANIPDVTVVPFLTSAEDVAAQLGIPIALLSSALGIGPGDFVTPDAFALIATHQAPLPENVVLDAREVAEIRAAIDAYNAFIAKKAKQHGAALVDIHATLGRIQKRDIVIGGRRLTTAFLGGLFSLDGIHPTNTGYAVIANRFIRALNRKFDADIRRVSLVQVKNDDPLVLPAAGRRAGHGHISAETARSMRELTTK
jgi:phospholipase/lecithinase/hemolysin